jgi:3-oxoacyl-[acyl-carrier-protein] synthase-1
MRRVVITGMGIVSQIGDNLVEVLISLKEGHSGITVQPADEELNLRSRIGGFTRIDIKEHIISTKRTCDSWVMRRHMPA